MDKEENSWNDKDGNSVEMQRLSKAGLSFAHHTVHTLDGMQWEMIVVSDDINFCELKIAFICFFIFIFRIL